MKKFYVILASVLTVASLCVNAQKRTLVVKGTVPRPIGSMVVFVEHSDSIIVVPGENTQDIEINVKDSNGDTVSLFVLLAQMTNVIDVETMDSEIGCVIEIKDDTGAVCEISE